MNKRFSTCRLMDGVLLICVADAGRNPGPPRPEFEFKRRSLIWGSPWLPHQLPGGWRRQQQWLFFAGPWPISCSLSVLQRSNPGVPDGAEFRIGRIAPYRRRGVNVVTKSGSNKFHGTGFYYLRDSSLDARSASLDIKPSSRQHQFGFTVGGPIRRNRAFFFAGYDQHIFHEPTVVRFVNGGRVVVPQAGAGPATPGDYEATDQA